MMRKLLVVLFFVVASIGVVSGVTQFNLTNGTTNIVIFNGTAGNTTWGVPSNITELNFVVIGGGGGGGHSVGGGGGAGGVRTSLLYPVVPGTTYNITVGAGGSGGATAATHGANGTFSMFGNLSFYNMAAGGGGGGSLSSATLAGYLGGSGGGTAGTSILAGGVGNIPSTTPSQGNRGGIGYASVSYGGGGGGGISSVGGNGTGTAGGSGGAAQSIFNGLTTDIYAGGGGAGISTGQIAGLGGSAVGGNGTNSSTVAGGNAKSETGSGGGGGGFLSSTGSAGGNGATGIVIIWYENASAAPITPISANFTQSANPSVQDASVTFNDTSTGTPTTWNWTFGDGNTSTVQHPVYAFPDVGSYWVDLNVTNSTGSFSNYTAMHNVTNATGFTPQDIWMEGQYLQTFHITDSATGLPIPVVDLQDTAMQTYTTTNGTGYLTEPFGASTVVFIADDYNSKSVSYFFDSAENHSVQMTKPTSTDPSYQTFPPKDVKFHIVSFFGAPIPEATVSVLGVTTSTGNWDWLVTLFGIPLDEVAINGTAMNETTDSNGDAVFLMLSSVKYNITVTAPGYTFPSTVLAPQATEYTITANWNESWFSSGNDTLKDVNVSVSWVKFNDTHSFVNITYDDQTMTTTGGTITVYRDSTARVANASAISTMDITSSSCSNSTLVNTPTGGASYRVLVNATTTDQNIMRTFTHYFKGAPVTLPGWTSETLLWLALFIVIFTAAFAGAIHSPQMAIVLCVESWIFWAIGWLDALITQFWYGETAIIGVLVLASFLAVVWNITEGKSKVKRSS